VLHDNICSCSKVGNWLIAVSAFKAKVLIQFLCWWLRLYLRPALSYSNSSLQKIMSVLLMTQGWKISVLSGLSVWVF
jgi:cyanate permease